MRRLHKLGIFTYYKCVEEEMNIESLAKWIDEKHNIEMLPILKISEMLCIPRKTIMAWCNDWGVKLRSISEDNARRYKNMSDADKKNQVLSANKKCRELFQDPEWKKAQIKKLLLPQLFRETKPEKEMQRILKNNGFAFVTQYQIGPYFYDIAIESIKTLIEVDGEYWHSLPKQIERDKIKNELASKNKWRLIRIPATKVFDAEYIRCTVLPVFN